VVKEKKGLEGWRIEKEGVSYSYESDDKGDVVTSDVSRKGFRK
jgi:hypothetical protein